MQGYGEGFAHIYNLRWTHFAQEIAPRIRAFYEATVTGATHKRMLDLACGTGQLAVDFLDHGYDVVGLDLSPAMLRHARDNAATYVATGRARFIEADAADFTPDEVDATSEGFGLVVSTFDALNHLPDFDDLEDCFRSTYDVLVDSGWFIFDLNTRFGLRRWGGISIQEDEDLVLITRGVVVEDEGRAYTQISGFLQRDDGLYSRFNEVAYNTIFALKDVADALTDTGFGHVHFSRAGELDVAVDDPERYGRIFVVAQR